jgi:hypothetical protein
VREPFEAFNHVSVRPAVSTGDVVVAFEPRAWRCQQGVEIEAERRGQR